MTHTHEVISAFLDDELFDPAELRAALDDPAARDLLIDLVALRQLTPPAVAVPPIAGAAQPRAQSRGRWLIAAAAVVVALAGGFAAGRIASPSSRSSASAIAPTPTRVIDIRNGEWQESPTGGQR